jgi:hypothetical protein
MRNGAYRWYQTADEIGAVDDGGRTDLSHPPSRR